MAWVDDRIWCHPKFTDLSAAAWKLYVCGLAYSSGHGTKGVLTSGQQALLGSTARTRSELVAGGLWDPMEDDATVRVHDWEEHNGRRDARREADRERKRRQRQKA